MPSTARKIAAPATATVAPTKPIVTKNAKPKSSPTIKPALSVVTSSKYQQTQHAFQRQAIEKSRSATLLCDLDWNITYVNEKFENNLEVFGPKISEAVSNWVWTTVQSLEGESVQMFFTEEPIEFKRATDARYHPYQKLLKVGPCILDAYIDSITDEQGTVTGYLVEMNDVTEQVQSEQRNRQLLAALEGSSVCIMITDTDLRPMYLNSKLQQSFKEWEPEMQKVFGPSFRADGILGRCIDDFHKDPAHQRKMLANESLFPFESQIKVGPLRIDLAINVIRGADGKVAGYTTEWKDNTARLKAEEDYKADVKVITERMEFLRGECSTDLAEAMVALSNGDFSMTLQANTPLLDIPAEPDLALMAETFNRLRNQTFMAVEAYNKAKDALGSLIVRAQNEVSRSTDRAGFMASALESLANGDLTKTIEDRANSTAMSDVPDLVLMADNLSSLETQTSNSVSSYNRAIQSLSTLIAQTQISAANIANTSIEVMTGNDDLAQRTEQQAASLEETASSMEEMTSTVKQNADNSKQANQLAKQARESAEKGGLVVTKAVSTMEEINVASKRIADIITVIDEIAFQTNLLALNAAVEAARVGEQGRGFAVVAAEVRNLAGRSATAAKEIKTLVQDSVQKVQDGSVLVNQSGSQLDEIVNSVKKVADIIAEITAAAQEQSAGIEQVNKAIIQMDQITQQNAALVEEASATSQSMNRQAAGLQSVVEKFTLDQVHVNRIQTENQASQSAENNAARRASNSTSTHKPVAKSARTTRPSSGGFTGGGDLDNFEEF